MSVPFTAIDDIALLLSPVAGGSPSARVGPWIVIEFGQSVAHPCGCECIRRIAVRTEIGNLVAAGFDYPPCFRLHLRTAFLATQSPPPDGENAITEVAELFIVNLHAFEDLVEALPEPSNLVVPVVRLALDTAGEGMKLRVGVKARQIGVEVTPVVGIFGALDELDRDLGHWPSIAVLRTAFNRLVEMESSSYRREHEFV